jgi:hypothetical protein
LNRFQFQVWQEEQSFTRRENLRGIEEYSMQNTNAEVGTNERDEIPREKGAAQQPTGTVKAQSARARKRLKESMWRTLIPRSRRLPNRLLRFANSAFMPALSGNSHGQ